MKIIYILVGLISLSIGILGILLPILPTFPFLCLTTFCFMKSSKRIHSWWIETKLYKENFESFVKKEGMTLKTKVKVMIWITVFMSIGMVCMSRKNLMLPCIFLFFIWLFHMYIFWFRIKTKKKDCYPS
ncbi:MAG: YbaN family protein [Floccifex sp.]